MTELYTDKQDRTMVNVGVIAKWLKLTERHVWRLVKDGTLVTEKDGKRTLFDLKENLQRYLRLLEERSERAAPTDDEARKLQAEAEWKEVRAAKERVKLEQMEKEFHLASDVQEAMEQMHEAIRSKLEALPDAVAADIANASTPMEAAAILRSATYRIMEELAQFQYEPVD